MSHQQQIDFCLSVKKSMPSFFSGVMVLDIGALDINGNNLYLFDKESLYLGLDVAEGKNIDIVCPAHQLSLPDASFDVIVSTECLEHDMYWQKTLANAIRLLKPGGLLLVTCATTGRHEHGTRRTTPQDAPLLATSSEEWGDYYRNLDEQDIRSAIDLEAVFKDYSFSFNDVTHDLYFYGIKNGDLKKRVNRSINLNNHPLRAEVGQYEARLSALESEGNVLKKTLERLIQADSLEQDIKSKFLDIYRTQQLALDGVSEIAQVVSEIKSDGRILREGLLEGASRINELIKNYDSSYKIDELINESGKWQSKTNGALSHLSAKIDSHALILKNSSEDRELLSRVTKCQEIILSLYEKAMSCSGFENNIVGEYDSFIAAEKTILSVIESLHESVISSGIERDSLKRDLLLLRSSRAYKFALSVSSINALNKKTSRYMIALVRYILRGDFYGIYQRVKSICADNKKIASIGQINNWCVISTKHTVFVANLIAERLKYHGWSVTVLTEMPQSFQHEMYFVICPQMFDRLPPPERRIVYQMEQSVSSRWFTSDYISCLENSLAVLDYSRKNIDFLFGKGIVFPHINYLPVGSLVSYKSHLPVGKKVNDVLFYGDANSSPRRKKLLDDLKRNFQVKVCGDLFYDEMVREIKNSKVVVNIHYYENALLEMPRIQECISLGVPVVSESSQDQNDYPEIMPAVHFFEQGNSQAMIACVQSVLAGEGQEKNLSESISQGAKRFSLMFDRFLVSMKFLEKKKIFRDDLYVDFSKSKYVSLSLPETTSRRRSFEENGIESCYVFDGLRYRPGWVGCALSYSFLARSALKFRVKKLVIMEDDVLMPDDFQDKMRIIDDYLEVNKGQWDIFSGVMAVLHPETKVLKKEVYKGLTFLTVDRIMSMVFNIYSSKAIKILSRWNYNLEDDQVNTIDRYLESCGNLRVVVCIPFIVGHKEELHSTLWGIKNEQYSDLIRGVELRLLKMSDDHI